ncbi:hypothetical protein MCMEM_0645 [Methanococcoides methylutens MM1]|uniref:Uncharacterized protein n=1 Tax=Methanococcoides methylutens MM1 TaxID=1434104 RepID=A0A0E3SR46_METMT|nr:hypothetical protein MCMEM_0645 [Methanococcoides methylutens MM1]
MFREFFFELSDSIHPFAFYERCSCFYPVCASFNSFFCDLYGAIDLQQVKCDLNYCINMITFWSLIK